MRTAIVSILIAIATTVGSIVTAIAATVQDNPWDDDPAATAGATPPQIRRAL